MSDMFVLCLEEEFFYRIIEVVLLNDVVSLVSE